VRAAATICHLCEKPFTADDPPVADHVIPRAYGGSDDIENLRAAHRSCNGRKGATLPCWTPTGSSRYRAMGLGMRAPLNTHTETAFGDLTDTGAAAGGRAAMTCGLTPR
jgi:hypothetical protein